MPAIAAAALARMRAETELMPATSTTEAASSMSLAPTIGRVSPAAIVETISLGTPTGQRPHGLGGDRRVARAARREHAVAAPLGDAAPATTAVAPRAIVEHGLAAIARGAQRLDVGAGRGGHLLAPHVGLDQRLAHDAGVDEDRGDARGLQAIAQERVLAALRVQRAYEHDGLRCHQLLLGRFSRDGT